MTFSPTQWRRARLASLVLPVLVLVAAGAVSYHLWDRERREIERALKDEFDTRVRETVGLFRERMLAYEQALHATHGLFASSPRVERGDFQAFVASLRIQTHTGLQGMGYSLRIPAGERARHERNVRTQGYPAYSISPAGDRPEVTSALYFEPSGSSLLSTLGTDYYAEPSRKHAMDAARDSASIAISNKIKLPEENAEQVQAGYRMYLPVYGAGKPPATVEERRRAITGWIYAAFSMDGLLSNILGERPNIAIEVYDAGVGQGDEGVQDSLADRVGGESAVKLLFSSQRVQVGGYSWIVTAQSLPNFTTPIATSKLQLVAGVGAAASVLLALFSWAVLRRRMRRLIGDAQLRSARDKAEAASRAKSQFLAAASHDLRQPVQALGLFTATLQAMARKPQLSGEEVAQVASRLQLALQGLGRLLNGLFDLSGLDSGTVSVEPRPVDVSVLLAELHSAFAGPAQQKGLGLTVRLPRTPQGLWLHVDPVILARVLSNLVANALRYTNKGRILIGCRRRRGALVEIQVLDTGIGIAPDEQDRIFGEFYQVANVRRERERGMGLGLAIAQRSAHLLGTSIAVRSSPGRGSVFSVTLPVAMTLTPEPDANALEIAPRAQGRVLVIDDDPQLTQATQRLLQELGFAAVVADTVDSACTAAANARDIGGLALIVSDYQLRNGESGLDAIHAASRESGGKVPAMLLTGDTSAECADQARVYGYPVLHKPVDPAALIALVHALTRSPASP
ncbi:CHASE domain-containing protein [Caenimonas sp. SL110]|uniref:CHASE domain-containing protein n=1 Tax=Caenimonas sp. SL110 TaxID=1450524 RepID=UPI00069E2CA9|nr:CHASE domain-containing protein [Caenimonas sp. SL110]